MKRIVFFTEPRWAFGQIHYSLCRRLFQYDINAEVLDFFQKYSAEEMRFIDGATDYFVTTPVGVMWLLEYGINPNKIVSIAHAQWDLLLSNSKIGTDIYDQLAGYAVVSNILFEKSRSFSINRQPRILHLGIEFDKFYQKPSKQLKTVGFAGAFESFNFAGQEIKRGRLVQEVAFKTNCAFKMPKCHYLAMPGFYSSVDCVIQASTEEGAGLPMMEAAAAGRLCIGTTVGYFAENAHSSGVAVPLPDSEFVDSCVRVIDQTQRDNDYYIMQCEKAQAYARDHYDWGVYIEDWAEYFLNLP